MVQIPDSARPYVIAVQKFHFWILAALVPLVLLPLLFMAQAEVFGKIESQRNKITGSLSAVEAVLQKRPHPNEKWSQQIGARAREMNDETLQVWEQLWKAQEPLRQWPELLGDDFAKAATALRGDGTLKRSLRERYQNEIRPAPRALPKRMGVDDLMGNTSVAAGTRESAPDRPAAATSLAQWSQADQKQLFDSFNFAQLPSTTQIVMAQEELWMYGVLCDVIRNVNSRPVAADPNAVITPANIAIPFVQAMKIGYLAAEQDPGGRAGQRILGVHQEGGDGGMAFPGEATGSDSGSAGRPPHPRFGGSGGQPGSDDGASPDDALRNWVYVDLEGRPLMAADLANSATSRILRLMPFVLSVTIDQRAIDALLVELASAPVPIDTRQVRIPGDPTSGGDFGGRGSGRPSGESSSQSGDRPRFHDVRLELRGTLAIVMRPDPSLLKADDGSGQGGDSE